MKITYKLLSLIIAFIGLVSFTTGNTQAASQQENADFEIQPILPRNQVDLSLNYFDIQTKPDTKQVISMRVQNFTDHKIVVESSIRNAYTEVGGNIDFTENTKQLDKSLKVPITSIAKLDESAKKIYLGPKEAKIINTTITMPKENFDGFIYGDWHFIEYVKKSTKDTSSVSSNYAYSVGIALRGNPYKVYPDLRYKGTKTMLYNRHPAIGIKLRNVNPMLLKDTSIKATVKKKGAMENQRSYITTEKKIAPNSEIILPISWAYDSLKPGTYEVTASIHGFNLWNKLPMDYQFKEEITIKKDETDAINRQSIKRPINKWAIVATATGALMVMSLVAMLKILAKSGL